MEETDVNGIKDLPKYPRMEHIETIAVDNCSTLTLTRKMDKPRDEQCTIRIANDASIEGKPAGSPMWIETTMSRKAMEAVWYAIGRMIGRMPS